MNSLFLLRWSLAATLAATALSGCGGGGGGAPVIPPPPPPPPPSARGTLLTGTVDQGKVSTSLIEGSISAAEAPLVTDNPNATSIQGYAKCPVELVKLVYSTVSPQVATNDPTAAMGGEQGSAALLVPLAGCGSRWPLMSFQHGTAIGAVGSYGDTSPSIPTMTLNLAAYFASQGYAVVIPDYLGYAESSLAYHPYLQAEPSGAVVIDAVRAARNWLQTHGYASSLTNQVLLTGTSEGGYVTMAAQRAMEQHFPNEFALTATVPTSGPYELVTTLDTFLQTADQNDESKTPAATLILEGLQYTWGDVYTNPADVYNAPWYTEMGHAVPLLPSQIYSGEAALRQNCLLPYNLTDPGGTIFGNCSNTPLMNPSFVSAYLAGTGVGASARSHVSDNNLLQNWVPATATTACYANLDPMATPNALSAQTYFAQQGKAALFGIEDVQAETKDQAIANWMATQSVIHPPGSGYHGQVEGPACISWARHHVFDPALGR